MMEIPTEKNRVTLQAVLSLEAAEPRGYCMNGFERVIGNRKTVCALTKLSGSIEKAKEWIKASPYASGFQQGWDGVAPADVPAEGYLTGYGDGKEIREWFQARRVFHPAVECPVTVSRGP